MSLGSHACGRYSTALALCLAIACLHRAQSAQAQDLGHKLVGTLGLDAGSQGAPGMYVADRVLYYTADSLRDGEGARVDVEGFGLDVFANAVGVAGVVALPAIGANWGISFAVPVVAVNAQSDRPEASVDRFGFGDVAWNPLQLGWRFGRLGVLGEYTLYLPITHFEASGNGIARGQVTHQVSLGGTISVDPAERWFASALVSYGWNQKKRGIDITRGDTLQVQGGLGVRPVPQCEFGVAGYAVWQVQDDQGSDIPLALRGLRDRAFGLGPEIAWQIPSIRTGLRLRYEAEFGVRSRPSGRILMFGVTFAAAGGYGLGEN